MNLSKPFIFIGVAFVALVSSVLTYGVLKLGTGEKTQEMIGSNITANEDSISAQKPRKRHTMDHELSIPTKIKETPNRKVATEEETSVSQNRKELIDSETPLTELREQYYLALTKINKERKILRLISGGDQKKLKAAISQWENENESFLEHFESLKYRVSIDEDGYNEELKNKALEVKSL